jgi:hypothetical protein
MSVLSYAGCEHNHPLPGVSVIEVNIKRSIPENHEDLRDMLQFDASFENKAMDDSAL